MSKRKHIIILGSPRSGKTNYFSAALQCFSIASGDKNPRGITVKAVNNTMAKNIAQTTPKYKSGNWIGKTMLYTDLELDVRFPYFNMIRWLPDKELSLRFTDFSGESFYTLAEDNTKLAKSEIEIKTSIESGIKKCDAILLMIDGGKILNSDYVEPMKDVMTHLETILNQRERNVVVEFIVTKSDELAKEWTEKNAVKLKRHVRALFPNLFNTLEWPEMNHKYDIFSVSCVPTDTVKSVDLEHGTIPNSNWNVEVMKTEVEPFCWLFENI